MIQIGTVIISDPWIPSDYDIAKHSLDIMECNARRMKHMIENGYFPPEYSDEEWEKFKKIKQK